MVFVVKTLNTMTEHQRHAKTCVTVFMLRVGIDGIGSVMCVGSVIVAFKECYCGWWWWWWWWW
jgi:hypothetical protein